MAKKALGRAKKRARTAKGHYKPDDPSTVGVNEAFESTTVSVGGVAAESKPPNAPVRKVKKETFIPLVTLEGDRMYPEQAKKYWAKIDKAAS